MFIILASMLVPCFIQAQEMMQVKMFEFQPTHHVQVMTDTIHIFAEMNKTEKIRSVWEEMSSAFEGDVEVLVQFVIRETYLKEVESLKDIAQKLHYMNDTKKKQREYLAELRKMKAAIKDSLRKKYGKIKEQGELEHMLNESPKLHEIKEKIQHAEVELAVKVEESEALNIRLQMLTEKRNRVMMNISSALEISDETREKIIRNIK